MEETRRCPRCAELLPVSEFGWRDRGHTRRQSYCTACQNAAWRAWYGEDENKRRHLEAVAERRQARVRANRALVREAKSVPCADCSRTFPPEAMDFDHVGDKVDIVSRLVYQVGPDRLRAEIEACEVVCAVCHRLRTATRADRDG